MKTQINTLVKGDHRMSIIGTPSEIRQEIALKVRNENPEKLQIELAGKKYELKANWSLSNKSCSFSTEIPLSVYIERFGFFGVIKNAKAYLTIDTNCNVTMSTNSKKRMYQYIKESEITIL
jgi:hypothetical protein